MAWIAGSDIGKIGPIDGTKLYDYICKFLYVCVPQKLRAVHINSVHLHIFFTTPTGWANSMEGANNKM